MLTEVNGILSISATELAELCGITNDNIRQLVHREKVRSVQRACYGSPALVEVKSLPSRMLAKVKEKYGERFDKKEDLTLAGLYKRDPEALAYYREYRTDEGTALSEKLINEYTVNASLLRALRVYYNSRLAYIAARGGDPSAWLWKNVSDIVNGLDKSAIPHTLPANHRRLRAKMEEFEDKGFSCLVSGKLCNRNKSKLSDSAKLWLLGHWANDVKQCTSIAQLYADYNEEAAKRGWAFVSTAKTIYNYIYAKETVPIWYGHRHGERVSKEKFAYQHSTVLPSMRDSLWYSDGTKLNYYYQYNDSAGKRKIGTLNVYEVMDAYSEVFLGYCISSTEDFKAQYVAYKMALQFAGEKPYQVSYDNQGGHKKNEEFFKRLAHLAINTQPYNGKSKTIESAFYRFQSQYLKRDWFFTGQNITAHTAESRSNREYILENEANLPTKEEVMEAYAKRRNEWNTAVMADGLTRMERYRKSVNPQCVKLSLMDLIDIFGLTHDKEITCTAYGIGFRLQNIRYDYMVLKEDGMPDLEWLEKNVDRKFTIKYDPEDMTKIYLYTKSSDGSLAMAGMAETKTLIHRGKQEQEAWEAEYIKRVEQANKERRIARVGNMEEILRAQGLSSEDYGMRLPASRELYRKKPAAKASEKPKDDAPHKIVSLGLLQKAESNCVTSSPEDYDPIADLYSRM